MGTQWCFAWHKCQSRKRGKKKCVNHCITHSLNNNLNNEQYCFLQIQSWTNTKNMQWMCGHWHCSLWHFGKISPSLVSDSLHTPSTYKHFSRTAGGLKSSQIIDSQATKKAFEWIFWGGGISEPDLHMQRHEGLGEGRERLSGALMLRAAAKRPHSRITSQKRLASCDTGNRMAFVSLRIMSSPGHITRNKTTTADANIITGEMMPSFSMNIYYMSAC